MSLKFLLLVGTALGASSGAAFAQSTPAPAPPAQQTAPPQDAPPPAGWATPEDAGGTPPGPVEVVTTAVRAAGELAQLGAAVGGQAVKGLLSRIPKP